MSRIRYFKTTLSGPAAAGREDSASPDATAGLHRGAVVELTRRKQDADGPVEVAVHSPGGAQVGVLMADHAERILAGSEAGHHFVGLVLDLRAGMTGKPAIPFRIVVFEAAPEVTEDELNEYIKEHFLEIFEIVVTEEDRPAIVRSISAGACVRMLLIWLLAGGGLALLLSRHFS
jgi:hypothetical protein